jgi:ketosteroid isomerase-like protein
MEHRREGATTEALERLADAFNAHDVDAVMSFFAEDCEMLAPRGPDPWGQRLTGPEEVREGVQRRFDGLPDVHYGDACHWVAGRRGCSEWLLTGTTPEGQWVEVRGCDLFEFRGDKVIRKDSYWKIVEQ